jgi:2-keto-4-pentenoate hydratase/2-oxohepta-3-ene-1,7-dioic acid hydratase in catechol pathway
MKLLRYGSLGREKPGVLDAQGKIRDLSEVVDDLDLQALGMQGLDKLRSVDPQLLPQVRGEPRIGCPIAHVGKFVAVGLNYSDHAAEAGMPIPDEPIIFMKATTCIVGPNDRIVIPKNSTKTDWEVELGIIVGAKAQYVPQDDALDYVAGYCVVNDVSERNFQLERGSQWDKGKGCDSFGPIGPWLATKDEIPDPQDLAMWLDVNGERCQTGSTRTMIFSCAKLVSYISQFMTLLPGDIITTGTPPGVGLGMRPPRFLKAGDVVTLGIEGLGDQRQEVVAYQSR